MHRFILRPNGDPFSRNAWDVLECERFGDRTMTFRGDLSPTIGLRNTVARLRKLYPGCRIRVQREG